MFGTSNDPIEAGSGAALSDEQRALVKNNLGLVAVHLRRFVPRDSRPRGRTEWRDLFQEGCLGLIQAAMKFDPARNIAFAAFALPRIHQAVSLAIRRSSTMLAIPRHPPKKRRKGRRSTDRCDPYTPPRMRSLPSESGPYGLRARQNRRGEPAPETVGDRLRDKYDRAVRSAGDSLGQGRQARDDRRELIHKLVEERLLVPQEDAKKALRLIARETGSSYARVAQCEKKLLDETRRALDVDPEFAELRRLARHDPVGLNMTLDDSVERVLAECSAEAFVQRFRGAAGSQRSRMLAALLEVAPADVDDMVRRQVSALPCEVRERVLRSVAEE